MILDGNHGVSREEAALMFDRFLAARPSPYHRIMHSTSMTTYFPPDIAESQDEDVGVFGEDEARRRIVRTGDFSWDDISFDGHRLSVCVDATDDSEGDGSRFETSRILRWADDRELKAIGVIQ